MLNYFDKSKKPVLQELVISGCKTKTSHMNELLKELSDYSYLRVLGISHNKLDKESMHYLADIANGNVMLRELDISWNEVTSLSKQSLAGPVLNLTYRYVEFDSKYRVLWPHQLSKLKFQLFCWQLHQRYSAKSGQFCADKQKLTAS